MPDAPADIKKILAGLAKQISDLREEVQENSKQTSDLAKDADSGAGLKVINKQVAMLEKRVAELEKKKK